MLIDDTTCLAIERCLEHGVPFYAACLPGQMRRTAFAAYAQNLAPLDNAPKFFMGAFNSRWQDNVWIKGNLTAEQAAEHDFAKSSPSCSLLGQSTRRDQYISSVSTVIERLKERGVAKSVISIVRRVDLPNIPVSEMYANLAEKSAGSFAYLCFMPELGCWMGAPPEVLVETDVDKSFRTMALAGTLPLDAAEWDAKNSMEHQIVVDYIMQKLESIGLCPCKGSRQSLAYGTIKHLYTPICGDIVPSSARQIFDALNPTPALCGYPKEAALEDIACAEIHKRDCYGGCVGLQYPDASTHAFVNIRCCRIANGEMLCFGGGGITPDSEPEDEWNEANAKIDNFLLRIKS